MTKEEFLKILEAFPGKKELTKKVPNSLEFANYDFMQIRKEIYRSRTKIRLDITQDEDLLCKVYSFLEIANWYIIDVDETKCIDEKAVLTEKSLSFLEKRLLPKLDEFFERRNSISVQGFMISEISEFLNSGRTLY